MALNDISSAFKKFTAALTDTSRAFPFQRALPYWRSTAANCGQRSHAWKATPFQRVRRMPICSCPCARCSSALKTRLQNKSTCARRNWICGGRLCSPWSRLGRLSRCMPRSFALSRVLLLQTVRCCAACRCRYQASDSVALKQTTCCRSALFIWVSLRQEGKAASQGTDRASVDTGAPPSHSAAGASNSRPAARERGTKVTALLGNFTSKVPLACLHAALGKDL